MQLKDLKLTCVMVKYFVILLVWLFIFKYFFDSYHLIKDGFESIKAQYQIESFLDIKFLSDNYEVFVPYAWSELNLFLTLLFELFILGLLYFIWNRLPILSQWLASWHESGQIHPVLGRSIAQHLREHRYLNIKNFMNLCTWEKTDRYYIHLHSKNEKLQSFMSAYDKDWDKDKQ